MGEEKQSEESKTTVEQVVTLEPPKPGVETSSYKILLWSFAFALLAPLPPFFVAYLSTKSWFPVYIGPAFQEYLTGLLATFGGIVGVVGIKGAMNNVKPYIEGRTEVSKLKANAQLAGVTGVLPPLGENATQIINSNRQTEPSS